MADVMIKTEADWWRGGGFCSPQNIIIIGNERGIFVGNQKAEVTFNGIQLGFVTGSGKYLVFNGKSHADIAIQEMFNKLKPFIRKGSPC